MHYFSLYLEFMRLKFKGLIEYRSAFILSSTAMLIFNGVGFYLVWIMVSHFGSINGWSPYEVLFLYALNLGGFAIGSCLFQSACNELPQLVKSGEFDSILTKPLNTFFHYFGSRVTYAQVPHLFLAIVILYVCSMKLEIKWELITIVFMIVTLLSGAMIQGALYIISAVTSFWFIQNNSLIGLIHSFRSFIRFPISAYDRTSEIILTFVLPYAFMNFYPAQFFLQKNDFMNFHPIFQFLSPIVAIIMISFAIYFWFFGINRYKSTGS